MSHSIELCDDGILTIRVHTVWTAREADEFFAELRPIHAAARRRFRRVLAMTQVATVQSPIVAMRIRNHALAIKQPGDRTAMLIGTMLGKLQLGRLGSNQGFGLFTSEDSARAWLLAP